MKIRLIKRFPKGKLLDYGFVRKYNVDTGKLDKYKHECGIVISNGKRELENTRNRYRSLDRSILFGGFYYFSDGAVKLLLKLSNDNVIEIVEEIKKKKKNTNVTVRF